MLIRHSTALFPKSIKQSISLSICSQEIYDSKLKMSRYDFNAAGFVDGFNNQLADRPFSEIHDFNTGKKLQVLLNDLTLSSVHLTHAPTVN